MYRNDRSVQVRENVDVGVSVFERNPNVKKKPKRPRKKVEITTMDELHNYLHRKIRYYLSEPDPNAPEYKKICYVLMNAVYYYSTYLYHKTPPKSRLVLSEMVDKYGLFSGVIVDVKTFPTKKGPKTRVLLIEPYMLKQYYGDPEKTKYVEDPMFGKPKKIDSHLWIDLDQIHYDNKKINIQNIMLGERIEFTAKIIIYRGTVSEHKRTRVGKYGLADAKVLGTYVNDGYASLQLATKPGNSAYVLLTGKNGDYRYNTDYRPTLTEEIGIYDHQYWIADDDPHTPEQLAKIEKRVLICQTIGIEVIRQFDDSINKAIRQLSVLNLETNEYEYMDLDVIKTLDKTKYKYPV